MTTAADSPPLPPLVAPGEETKEGTPLRQRLAPDLEIRIWLSKDLAGDKSLLFEVTAPALELQEKPFGPWPFRDEPQAYFDRFYGHVAASEWNLRDRPAALFAELAELLPPELQDLLWGLKDKGWTLWIRSEEEAWIPWETLKLCGKEGSRWVPGPFLCEAFLVTRWPAGEYCQRHLPVHNIAAVLGRFPDLKALSEERRFFEGIREEVRTVEFLPPVRHDVLTAMDDRSFDAWHFASHGEWHDYDPTGAEVLLASGETIQLREVAHEARNFCSNHPLVFLNVCHLGRGERGLVHWSGWTSRLVAMGAGAVLGALWPIDDRAAVEFSTAFYRAFFAGEPLGEAVWRARLHTRESFPENATWLAFTAYGHPLAVCAEAPAVLAESRLELQSAIQAERPSAEAVRQGTLPRSSLRLANRLRWATLTFALSLLVFGALAGVRTDTRIRLDLTAIRLAFTTGGDKTSPLTDSGIPLHSLTVAGFARMEMHPLELAWLDSQQSWRTAKELTQKVSLVAHDTASQVSIEAATPAVSPPGVASGSPMTTDRLWIQPGSRVVIHAVSHSQGFDVEIEMAPAESLGLSVHHPFSLSADFVEVPGLKTAAGLTAGQQIFLRGRLREDRPVVEIFPGNQNLMISGTLGPLAEVPLLRRDLPITAFDLLAQDTDGELRSTLVGEGQLSYPDHPWEPSLPLGAGDLLVVEGLREFRLSRLDLIPQGGGPLRLTLDGIARKVRSGPQGLDRDHRLSLYERWVRGRLVQSLVAWITGSIALALGLEELCRRLLGRA